ncbi:acyl-CoA dehydrogenase family protein, partial [Gemmatimonas sp.]|uniref:acyl-CoA dehydrogenase family protein n=1 Tax=Gemmatimonas sp. TaxID=1962908 RepID=UPI00333FDDEC
MSLIQLTDTQREIQQLARDYAQRELVALAGERDRESRFDRVMITQMAEMGFLGMLIPEQYDGLGLDAQSYLLALEEIAVGDATAAVTLSVHNSLPTQMILNFGNDAQRTEFLPPMARGELLGAFALSEPEAGSDAASLSTQAVRDGDNWVL